MPQAPAFLKISRIAWDVLGDLCRKMFPVAADHQRIPFVDRVDWPSQELRDLESKLPTLTWGPLGLHWP